MASKKNLGKANTLGLLAVLLLSVFDFIQEQFWVFKVSFLVAKETEIVTLKETGLRFLH